MRPISDVHDRDHDYDLSRIERELDGVYVDYHRQVGSTNDRAIELARSPRFVSPTLVLTEQQLAGRGQRDRTWWSSVESATFTWCVEGANSISDEPTNQTLLNCPSLLPIAAGLAVAETIVDLAPDLESSLSIKWPNDVLVGQNKVAGVLVESIALSNSKIYLVGIGINVNQTRSMLATSDPGSRQVFFPPSSLRAELHPHDRQFDRTELVIGTLTRLSSMLRDPTFTGEILEQRISPKISFLNQKISFETSNKEITHGTVVGISSEGGLVMRTSVGEVTFFSGSVRPPVDGSG